jgi:hypothetical protein
MVTHTNTEIAEGTKPSVGDAQGAWSIFGDLLYAVLVSFCFASLLAAGPGCAFMMLFDLGIESIIAIQAAIVLGVTTLLTVLLWGLREGLREPAQN